MFYVGGSGSKGEGGDKKKMRIAKIPSWIVIVIIVFVFTMIFKDQIAAGIDALVEHLGIL